MSTIPTPDSDFVITRTFDAPRAVVWSAWTQREQLMGWFGPKGVTIPTCSLDLRPGGVFHYCMRTPDGNDMWGRWTFREIVQPSRLVFVVCFSDPQGGATRAPFDASWPLEMLSTVTFEESQGTTTVTVRWSALNANAAEQQTFDQGHGSMQQGWSGTMEQLHAFLAARRTA